MHQAEFDANERPAANERPKARTWELEAGKAAGDFDVKERLQALAALRGKHGFRLVNGRRSARDWSKQLLAEDHPELEIPPLVTDEERSRDGQWLPRNARRWDGVAEKFHVLGFDWWVKEWVDADGIQRRDIECSKPPHYPTVDGRAPTLGELLLMPVELMDGYSQRRAVRRPLLWKRAEEMHELKREYLRVWSAIRAIFLKLVPGTIDRAVAARGATQDSPKSYLVLNPEPVAPEEIDDDAFERFARRVGPDFWRMRVLDPRVGEKRTSILPAGGSCPIESWGTRLLKEAKALSKAEGAEASEVALVERLLALAPTFTHASGAFLSGAQLAVHYVEDRLWAETLEAKGLQNARARVTEVYRRIERAVERRALLINPDSVLLSVNFDELRLREGPLEEWFSAAGMPYDPDFGLAEVLYTYVGPRLLELAKGALLSKYPERELAVTGTTLHARLKQVDHLGWESMEGFNSIILGGEPSYKQVAFIRRSSPARMGVALMRLIRDTWRVSQSGASGFFDTPFSDGVLHEMPAVAVRGRRTDTIGRVLENPKRLHRLNLMAHLEEIHRAEAFPLKENPFVCYATQFLWDLDFRFFLLKVDEVNVKAAEKQYKGEEIKTLMRVLTPKLDAYLRYIMEGGDYPSEIRNGRLFS